MLKSKLWAALPAALLVLPTNSLAAPGGSKGKRPVDAATVPLAYYDAAGELVGLWYQRDNNEFVSLQLDGRFITLWLSEQITYSTNFLVPEPYSFTYSDSPEAFNIYPSRLYFDQTGCTGNIYGAADRVFGTQADGAIPWVDAARNWSLYLVRLNPAGSQPRTFYSQLLPGGVCMDLNEPVQLWSEWLPAETALDLSLVFTPPLTVR